MKTQFFLNRRASVQDLFLLALFPLVFVVTIARFFWTRPEPSDPLEYISSIPWGTTRNYFPWLDRINLGTNLAAFYHFLPGPLYWTSPVYALTITTATLVLAQWWLYRKVGFSAAWMMGIFVNSSAYFIYFGSQIFPEPTAVFYALIASLLFCHCEADQTRKTSEALAGVFAAMACLSKVTALFLPLLMIVLLARQKRGRWFALGVVGGGFLSLALFVLAYDWASLVSTLKTFFGVNLGENFAGRIQYNNAVTYYDVLTDRTYLPIFLGLLVSAGAYRFQPAKQILRFAWSFVFTIFFIYIVSNRGYVVIANYIYPGYFFTTLALAAYFGHLLPMTTTTQKLLYTFLGLIALVVGLRFGMRYDPTLLFQPGYYPDLSKWVKMIFGTGIFALIVLLLSVELKADRRRVAGLALLTAFWSSAYGGGIKYDLFSKVLQPTADFFYDNSPALNLPTAQRFDVFVTPWNKVENRQRLAWLYLVFFNKKFDASQGQLETQTRINEAIHFMDSANELIASHGEQILTDQPDLVRAALPAAQLSAVHDWNGQKLYVLDRQAGATKQRVPAGHN